LLQPAGNRLYLFVDVPRCTVTSESDVMPRSHTTSAGVIASLPFVATNRWLQSSYSRHVTRAVLTQYLTESAVSVRSSGGARKFHFGGCTAWRSPSIGGSGRRSFPEVEAVCRHRLKIFTAETIKIRNCEIIWRPILDQTTVSRWSS